MKSLNNIIYLMKMLSKKKDSLGGRILSTQKNLERIRTNLDKACKDEIELNDKMNECYQSGVFSRDEIYRNIRLQGNIIYNLQTVRDKISRHIEEMSVVNNTLSQYKTELLRTERKYQKISLIAKRFHHEKLSKINFVDDNEIQEIIIYDRENHTKNTLIC